VLFSDLFSYQNSVDAAAEARAATIPVVNKEATSEPVAIAPVNKTVWDFPFVFGSIFLMVFLSFIMCLRLVEISPLSKHKKCSWLVALLLAVPLVYSTVYGYIIVRENVLGFRFSLDLKKTIVILESCGYSQSKGPYRVFHSEQSELKPSSITNVSPLNLILRRVSDRDYDICNLSANEMQMVIDLLKSRRVFAMGRYTGQWGRSNGTDYFITILEDGKKTTVSCWIDKRGKEVFQLYKDLENVRPWNGIWPKWEGVGRFCLGCGGFHCEVAPDEKADCSYTVENNGVFITRYFGEGGDVVIPKALKDSREFPVVSIGDDCFRGCTNLTGITIPAGVTNAGDSAFEGCSRLTNITFLGGVPSVGSGAFDGVHTNAVVYFTKDTPGWGSMLGGLPTRPAPIADESLKNKDSGVR
jgi:hypothetical protein